MYTGQSHARLTPTDQSFFRVKGVQGARGREGFCLAQEAIPLRGRPGKAGEQGLQGAPGRNKRSFFEVHEQLIVRRTKLLKPRESLLLPQVTEFIFGRRGRQGLQGLRGRRGKPGKDGKNGQNVADSVVPGPPGPPGLGGGIGLPVASGSDGKPGRNAHDLRRIWTNIFNTTRGAHRHDVNQRHAVGQST